LRHAINKGAIAENEAKPEKTVATGGKMELLLPSQETLHTRRPMKRRFMR